MSGFDAQWLRRREPFDAAARDPELARRFGAALGAGGHEPRRIVDLAAGTGANFRALAPLFGGDQEWLLVDHDPALISQQATEISRWAHSHGWHVEARSDGVTVESATGRWRARARTLNLAQDLEALHLTTCDGITTTAFLDLVSAMWLDRLCSLLALHCLPLLATLTVDGRRAWHPPLASDARIDDAFRRHQARDKGFGPAQGGLAAAYLAARLVARGYEVATARSDWQIGTADRGMLARMIDESAVVACETDPEEGALFARWTDERHAQTRSGLLSLEVGHLDMLAIPTR